MTAGFKVADQVYWGTNGAVEDYVEALAEQAAARFGARDPLAVFLHDEREGFHSGKVVYLDEWLTDDASRGRMIEILDAATDEILRYGTFTEIGREWIATVIAQLRTTIAPAGPA